MKYETLAQVADAISGPTDRRCSSHRITQARIALCANRALHQKLRNSGR